jgi:polysaccharide biosynthesis transport protein
LLAALVGGVAVAFLREQFDTRIFTAEDMRIWTGSTNVSIVPLFLAAPDGKRLPLPAENGGEAIVASDNGKLPPGVEFLLERPHSPEAEALRSLYTSVMLSRSETPPQALLVVSSFPGEGKTTVAVNLAIAMAQHGSTCLVDADLRRGRVASALGIPSKLGLTDVLNGTTSLDRVLVRVPSVPNLTVVPAHAGSIRAGQLVCSDLMPKVLEDLRRQFQFIVIDCSPLLPFADGRVLSSMADGLIFVGRSGITTREVVQQSVDLLNGVNAAPIIEFVLNAADLSSPQYRYYQYGYEYYEPVAK